MTIAAIIVVFVILWWIVFFVTLPWGVRRAEHVEEGNDPGAPVNPRLWLKAGISTVIALILTAVTWWVITADLISFH